MRHNINKQPSYRLWSKLCTSYCAILSKSTLCLLLALSSPISAHALKETSSQIYLRDGQIEIRLYVDIEHWLEQLQDPQAWLLGDTGILVTTEEASSSDLQQRLSALLAKSIKVSLDNHPISLAEASHSSHTLADHIVEFRLSTKHLVSPATSLTIGFPKSLGNVHLSIAKPVYGVVQAGDEQSFSIK